MTSYMIVLSEGHHKIKLQEYLKKRLEKERCSVSLSSQEQGSLVVELSQELFEFEASLLKLDKIDKNGTLKQFIAEDRKDYDVDNPNFFTESEKANLLNSFINKIKTDEELIILAKSFKKTKAIHDSESMIMSCKRLGFVEYATPVHNEKSLKSLWKHARSHLFTSPDLLRDYFGEQVAYYYAWMNFYTLFLLLPAAAGVTMGQINKNQGWMVDDSPYVPFYTTFVILWSAFFCKFWRRQSNKYALKWNTLRQIKMEKTRSEFRGFLRKSPVTGQQEIYYPDSYRYIKYVVSALVSALMLSLAFSIMILSLNLQGYVSSSSNFFYRPYFSQYAQPDAIFDKNSMIMCYFPVLLHVIIIQTLNKIYRYIVESLTEWENHKTEQAFENSLIIKRYSFEAFDSYIALFYLAFFEKDIMKVRMELVSLYTADCIRRIAIEIILPIIIQHFSSQKLKSELWKLKEMSGEKQNCKRALIDQFLDPYEQFDDYLEMVLEFGYLTMFASAFPIGCLIQILYNLIEMKSDAFKLCFVVQRPPAVRENGIGSWQTVIELQACLAIFTNVLMFAISSDQMEQWFPQLFVTDIDINQINAMITGKKYIVVLLLFFFEHTFVLLVCAIYWFISDVPHEVDITMRKREYEAEQAWLKMARSKKQD